MGLGCKMSYFGRVVKDPAEVGVVGERLLDADYGTGDIGFCERKYINCHFVLSVIQSISTGSADGLR
jgi:hypothetical protein